MQNQFTASQTVEIAVQEAGLPIEQYLSAPDRIVAGLTDPGGVEQLGPEEFRLRLRPLHFLSLRFVPVALLRVYNPAPGELCIESQDCQLLGAEGFNQRFQLQLRGRLRSERRQVAGGRDRQGIGQALLLGQADLRVRIDLPPPFNLTPKAVVNATGNSLLKGILRGIQLRLKHQLVTDYHQWVTESLAVGARRP